MHKYKILEYKPTVNIKFNEMLFSEAELEKINERLKGFDERTFAWNTIEYFARKDHPSRPIRPPFTEK